MKYASYLALLLSCILLFPLAAFAKGKNQHSVDIPETVEVGAAQLNPGTYNVEWQETGPAVHVKFLQHGRTVATVPGMLKVNDAAVVHDGIVTETTTANRQVLREIDFGHQKEALAFGKQHSNM